MSVTLAYGDVAVTDTETSWNEQVISNVTASLETTLKKVGAGSCKFVVGSSFTTGLIASKALSPTLDFTSATRLSLWLRSTVEFGAGVARIVLSTTANCANIVKTIELEAIDTADYWTKMDITGIDFSGCSAIVSVGLLLYTDIGAVTIYLDGLVIDKVSKTFTELSIRGLGDADDEQGWPDIGAKRLLDGSYYETPATVANRTISLNLGVVAAFADRLFLRNWFFAQNHRYITYESETVEVVIPDKRFSMSWAHDLDFAKSYSVTAIEKTARVISSIPSSWS